MRTCPPSSGLRRRQLRRTAWALVALASLSLIVPEHGWSVNGLDLIGSGGMSTGLAGADTAIALDFSTINTNPAGMSFVGNSWAAGLSFGMLKSEQTLTNAQNNREGQDHPLFLGNSGILYHLPNTKVTLGIGFFTVGGLTSDFRDLATPLGTTDRIGSQLRHYKITPTISYQFTPRLSLGASLGLSYTDVSLAVLPNSPGAPGLGVGFQSEGSCDRHNGLAPPTGNCLYALGIVPKFGLMYRLTDTVTFGIAYTMASNLPLRNGRVTQNLGLIGLGTATYDAKATGLKWADDIAVGLAFQPNPDWLLSFKFQWINWDGALNSVVFDLSNGSNPLVPTSQTTFALNWRDQYVVAVGSAYHVNEWLMVHGGYNFGNDPTRTQYIDPTTANITVHHFVGGVTYKFTPGMWLDVLTTYVLPNEVTYNHPLWGPNTTSRIAGYDVIASFSYRR
ncbi:aromatic hydrocarbon degradation protein [Nitrospira sp.]|nr:aromatic hydrocarbon degradation protein [Nitrospira sp.]